MLRKLLSLTLAVVMLSATAFAATDIVSFRAALAEAPVVLPTFQYGASDIQYVTETAKVADAFLAQAKHEDVSALPAWDAEVAEAIVGGTGTAEDPYLISDGGELAYFANAVNGKLTDAEGNAIEANTTLCAKLDRDINLAKEDGTRNNWTSFAISGFKGTFDGQGHNVYNFYLSETGNSSRGLFRSINAGAKVCNLNMIDAKLTTNTSALNGNAAVSIVCGGASTDETNYTAGLAPVLDNIYVSGTASLMGDKKGSIYGGVVGQLKYANISNCFTDVAVNFAGNVATLNDYDNAQSANGSSIGVGGVVGVINHDKNYVKVANCGNAGRINAPDNRRVGGVIGAIGGNGGYSKIYVDNIFNTGDVDGLGQVAGCVGWGYVNKNGVKSTTKWYNAGNVTAHTEEETWASGIMNGTCTNTDKTFGGTLYSAGDVKIQVKDAETGEISYTYNDKCALLTCGMATTTAKAIYRNDLDKVTVTVTNDNGTPDDTADDTQETQQVDKWTTRANDGTTGTYGVGKTLAQIKALTASDVTWHFSSNMVADFGINDGMPVLASQKANLVLDEATYEIAKSETADKNLKIKVAAPGFVALDVAAIVEGTAATLEIYTADGSEKLNDVAVAEAGILSVSTGDETEILVKAAEGSSILVKAVQTEDLAVEELVAAPIRVNIESQESATIYLALFNGKTLEKIAFCPDAEVKEGYISGVINLAEEEIEGRVLKVYIWKNGILAPLADVQDL